MEEIHLLQAMRKLHPDVSMSTRKELSGRLLNKAHKMVVAKVEMRLMQDQCACITSDAWSKIRNELIINYTLMLGEKTLFLESIQSEKLHTHPSSWLRISPGIFS